LSYHLHRHHHHHLLDILEQNDLARRKKKHHYDFERMQRMIPILLGYICNNFLLNSLGVRFNSVDVTCLFFSSTTSLSYTPHLPSTPTLLSNLKKEKHR
jgi:hypothetical protein